MNIIPVILSGGSGTRLWPLSRKLYPKQFISLINETTLFQDTILRLPDNIEKPLIICNEEHRFLVAEQLREINKKSNGIVLEPTGKNTAPAVTLAALKLLSDFEDPIILVLSADHLIQDKLAFQKSIAIGEKLANQGKLVTFGITPTKVETGYGYIEILSNDAADSYEIKSFKEKPNKEVAKKYVESGKYFWNSGMFMFKASIFLDELKHFEPKILNFCKKSLKKPLKDFDFIRLNNKEFNKCQNISIDYAVMEHTEKGVVIPLDANWSDIGSWSSLWEVKPKDKNKNVSSGDVILNEVKNSYIHSSSRLVSVLGLSDIVIIDTQDALLVANKSYAQNIKLIVDKINKDNRSESSIHRRVYRPWGNYDSIDFGENFQVKRIIVNPKSKLSLQKHKFRSEHWVIVKGTAIITCEDKVFELEENESTYIPKGAIHRIENSKNLPLEIIEIQTGSYLGEDDIIRLEDDYSRN